MVLEVVRDLECALVFQKLSAIVRSRMEDSAPEFRKLQRVAFHGVRSSRVRPCLFQR
jgi:hypothetical protein